MLAQPQSASERVIPHPTVTDFCGIFTEDMHSLYLLSFVLTADHDKAEQCFVSGLGECVEGIDAFMEWSRLWARRGIINHAILMMRPAPQDTHHWTVGSVPGASAGPGHGLFAAVLSLSTFERFVFVLSILEGHSEADCASLLKCSRREVVIARELALSFLVTTDTDRDQSQDAMNVWRRSLGLQPSPER
jgi:hypothetical protein